MFLLFSVFAAGVLHGLGPDHLAAVTALGGRDFRRLTALSMRFAIGHAGVLALAGLMGHFGRQLLPAAWETRLELFAGGLLVLTGTAILAGLLTGKLALHSHEHRHDGSAHRHLHMHWLASSGHRHLHGKLAVALGALFALGGARALLAVVPIALAATLAASLLRIAAFALGLVLAMSAYGWLAGRLLSRLSLKPYVGLRAAVYASALFCLAAGTLTLANVVLLP